MTDPLHRKGQLSRKKTVAFTVLILTLIAIASEAGARAFLRTYRGYDGEHLLQYQFDNYKNILPTPGFRDTRGVTYNSVGFRRKSEVDVKRSPRSLRIFLMGASTAHGTGGLWPHIQPSWPVIPDSSTIDQILERRLRQEFPGRTVEVVNAAIPSTWTHHSLIYLNQSILRYRPDVVLFLDGFNDFYRCDPAHDQFASYTYGERATTIMGPPTLPALVQANAWWVARRSAAAYLLFRTVQSLAEARNQQDPRPLDVDSCFKSLQLVFPENALEMWRRSGLILRDRGIDALFILQPLLILEDRVRPLTRIEQKLRAFELSAWRPGWDSLMHRAAPWVSDTARASIASVGQSYLDLTRVFAGQKGEMFTDYAHLTPPANAIVADRIAAELRPLLSRRVAVLDSMASAKPVVREAPMR